MQPQHDQQRREGPEGGAGRGDGNPEVDFHKMAQDRTHQRCQQEAVRMRRKVRIYSSLAPHHHAERGPGEVHPRARDHAEGKRHREEISAPQIDEEAPQRQCDPSHQADPEPELSAVAHQPQPVQTPIHDRAEEPHVNPQPQHPAVHQRIQCLIVGTVGRGIARFDVPQFDFVEAVVRHVHGLGTVADQGAQPIPGVLPSIGVLQRLVRRDQFLHALPDEGAHPP